MISRCKFGGGHQCKNQGGDGSSFHKSTFLHPFTSLVEVDKVADGFICKSSDQVFTLDALEDSFDDDFAKSILDTEIFQGVMSNEYLRKALYDIDVDSADGITRILSLLPILDPEILKMIYQECFPGSDPEKISPRLIRIELRGYLTDMLEQTEEYGETESTEPSSVEDAGGATAEAGDIDSEEVDDEGDNEAADQVTD